MLCFVTAVYRLYEKKRKKNIIVCWWSAKGSGLVRAVMMVSCCVRLLARASSHSPRAANKRVACCAGLKLHLAEEVAGVCLCLCFCVAGFIVNHKFTACKGQKCRP